jgi:tryptophan-rich sensory protein
MAHEKAFLENLCALDRGRGGGRGAFRFLTRDGTEIYSRVIEQPPFSPPAVVFPVVWSILFLLMGVSSARIYAAPASADRTRGLLIFALSWRLISSGAFFSSISRTSVLPFSG